MRIGNSISVSGTASTEDLLASRFNSFRESHMNSTFHFLFNDYVDKRKVRIYSSDDDDDDDLGFRASRRI